MFSQPSGGEVKVEGGNMFQPGPTQAFPAHQPNIKLGYSGFDNQYSATSSESGPDAGAKYQIKTMCLAKKTVRMPTKKEHGFLLFCGLGARKWACPMDCNSLTFKQAILNIYPRLRSVIGYNLWTLTSDKKTFERIPEKINTPMRMRAYLGASFTGCLVIVPVSDIVLMEERREHLRQMDIEDSKPASHSQLPGLFQKQQLVPQEEPTARRSLCLICGRIEKTPGTGVFHKIMEEPMPGATDRSPVIAKKLTDILGFNFEQSRKKFIASNEICRKCLRTVCDLVRKEEEVKATKEDLVTSFFSTTSKFNKNQMALGMAEDATCPEYQHPFHQKPLPLPMAFLNQVKPGYLPPTSLVQFYRPSWKPDFPASQGSSSAPGSPPERKQNSAYNRLGSDTSSDVASSSFISVSPPVEAQRGVYPTETDSTNGRASPSHLARDFDARSYASTFSLHSTGSSLNTPSQLRSKGQIKSYESYEEKEKLQESRLQGEEMGSREGRGEEGTSYEPVQPRGDKEGSETYSTPQSPRSQDSSNSGASDSLESTDPTRPGTPEEEKAKSEAEEAEVERRKPWKKRKRAIESDQESIQSEKVAKVEPAERGNGDSTSTSSATMETFPNPQGQNDHPQQ